ncbi:MAG: Holliday junction resolvase RuvX [Polyangiaceae bacterium]|nr:Holliday junction resolvase RuvX [Polyangiaceae bacterium]
MRALGIDCGEARVGVAVSDEDRKLALPLCTVPRGRTVEATAQAVARALAEHPVDTVVVGLPLRLDGTEGLAVRKARALGDAIGVVMGSTPIYWDERLTTAAAERSLKSQGLDGRARRRVVDQSAAAILLQSYLDSRSERAWDDEETASLAAAAPPPGRVGDRRRGRRIGR